MKFQIAALGLMASAGLLAGGLPTQQPGVDESSLEAHETNASASLVGQFRTNVSAWLWLRTDLYLHNGVEMRPLTEAEKRLGKEADQAAHDDGLHEGEIVTVVPGSEHDFRGAFGDIERAVSTYKPMQHHGHNDPRNAMPLFRLMTWLDPKFEKGWTIGASVIARDDTDKGLAYLREGLRANTRNVAILTQLGSTYAAKKREFRTALGFLDKAIALGEKSPENSDDFLAALRWAALCHRELGERDLMQAVGAYGLTRFPGDPVLTHAAESAPLILSESGRKGWLGIQKSSVQ